ncbi:MAG: hypothetical protein H6772_02870 [Pseudomonadales bacterium]|nr:hypothetical protein [Pseudomonadales bacterium]
MTRIENRVEDPGVVGKTSSFLTTIALASLALAGWGGSAEVFGTPEPGDNITTGNNQSYHLSGRDYQNYNQTTGPSCDAERADGATRR